MTFLSHTLKIGSIIKIKFTGINSSSLFQVRDSSDLEINEVGTRGGLATFCTVTASDNAATWMLRLLKKG